MNELEKLLQFGDHTERTGLEQEEFMELWGILSRKAMKLKVGDKVMYRYEGHLKKGHTGKGTVVVEFFTKRYLHMGGNVSFAKKLQVEDTKGNFWEVDPGRVIKI